LLAAEAGIKTWMLTGDKLETAVNIAYATQMLTSDMTVETISGTMPQFKDKPEAISAYLHKLAKDMELSSTKHHCAWAGTGDRAISAAVSSGPCGEAGGG
jgi:magnesium-transporting ATPase (P-type)